MSWYQREYNGNGVGFPCSARVRIVVENKMWWNNSIRIKSYETKRFILPPLSFQWRHNGRVGVSNHLPHDCLLNGIFRRRSKKTQKLRVTGLCEGNSPVTGEFPSQRASKAENVSVSWRHHIEFTEMSAGHWTTQVIRPNRILKSNLGKSRSSIIHVSLVQSF